MKAVILCAGRGKRLEPLTSTRQKCMIPIAGKPILYHLLSAVKRAGIKDIVVVVHEHKEEIINYFGNGKKYGLSIKYVDQKNAKGTAHAVYCAREYLNDSFLVINGDLIFEHNTMEHIRNFNGENLVVGAQVEDVSNYGVLNRLSPRGGLKEIVEKPKYAPSKSLVNAGIYLFNPDFIDIIEKMQKKQKYFDIVHAINDLVLNGSKINILRHKGYFHDIGRPWELLSANEFVMSKIEHKIEGELEPGVTIKGDVVIEKGTLITGQSYIKGPVYIGKNCEIGPNCFIRDNVNICDNSRIGRAVEVKNTLILNNSKAEHLAYIGDSLIGAYCNFGAGTKLANLRFDDGPVIVQIKGKKVSSGRRKMGAIIGDYTKTGVNTCFMPGVKAGPNARIGAGVILSQDAEANQRVILKQEYFFSEVKSKDDE